MEKKITLEKNKGTYVCTCGTSKTIPICDGSHKTINEKEGKDFHPIMVKSNNDSDLMVDCKTWNEETM